MWFWHSPFQIAPADLARLREMGVEELFVRAGTLSTDGERVVLSLPQRFEEGWDRSVELVINADAGVLHRFEDLSMPGLAQTIATDYRAAKAASSEKHLDVKGLQLDIDVPTRLLPKYAELLRDVRPLLPKGDQLSITSLTTWFSSEAFADVVAATDFYAPQFYEASVPASLGDANPIANLQQLEAGLRRAGELGVPFYVGAPSYGQALMFDEKGKLAGTYRGLSPEDACRHPSLRLDTWTSKDGEEQLLFQAVKAGVNGKGLGYRILYRRPTPETIARFYRDALANRPSNCIGVALFRVPEEGESLSTPLPALQAALLNQAPNTELRATPHLRLKPFSAIEMPDGKIDSLLSLDIENVGNGDTCIGPDALRLELRFPAGSVQEVQPGGFAQASLFLGEPSSAGKVSLSRSDGVVLWRAHLAPGEKVRCGPVLFTGSGRLRVRWTTTDPSGRTDSGDFAPITFGKG